ncbi:MAG: hypothetical protein EXR99_09190 [Gemmataceae bacterium]|nr:hypothetical protein [Gemmataceae bacterium]
MRIPVLFIGVVFLSGCGGGGPALYPVKGKVVLKNGAPVKGGQIELESEGKVAQRFNASGVIKDDGSFELETQGKKGAVQGKHRVVMIPPPGNSDLPINQQPKRLFHKKYLSYATGNLSTEVKPGNDNQITLTLDPDGP